MSQELPDFVPDFDDGVPIVDDAEPEEAGIEHEASAEDVLPDDEQGDE